MRPTGNEVKVDENPVGCYGHFCNIYNNSCNVVDDKEYELPNLNSWRYKLFRFSWNPFSKLFDFDCDSFTVFFEILFHLYLPAWPILFVLSAVFFGSREDRARV